MQEPRHEPILQTIRGGVGEDESAAMKAEAENYPLSVVFSAGKYGEYLAHVPVRITDRSGKVVLDTVKKGSGTFSVSCASPGKGS